MTDAHGKHHVACAGYLAIGKLEGEATRNSVDSRHLRLFELRHESLLEFESVSGERLDPHGDSCIVIGNLLLGAKVAQGEGTLGVRKVGSKAVRLEQHSRGHMLAPGLHGRTEDPKTQSCGLKMGGNRQPVGTSTNNGDFRKLVHNIP